MKDSLSLRLIPDQADAVKALLGILQRVKRGEIRITSVVIKEGKPGGKVARVAYEEIGKVQ